MTQRPDLSELVSWLFGGHGIKHNSDLFLLFPADELANLGPGYSHIYYFLVATLFPGLQDLQSLRCPYTVLCRVDIVPIL